MKTFFVYVVGVPFCVAVLFLIALGGARVLEIYEQRQWIREHGSITIRGDFYMSADEFRVRSAPLKGFRVVSADDEKVTVEYFFNCPIELAPGVQYPTFKIPQPNTHLQLTESSTKVLQRKSR